MSEIQNNENVQTLVGLNNQNLINNNNNQHNLVVVQNGENNIPFNNQPFMGPQANIQLGDTQFPNNKAKKKYSLPCLFLVCFSICIATMGLLTSTLFGFAYLIGSALAGNYDWCNKYKINILIQKKKYQLF